MKNAVCCLILFLTVLHSISQVPAINSVAPAHGPAGSSITITGTNFSPVALQNVVDFGGVRGAVTMAGATSLTAIVPTGAIVGPISITVNNLTACFYYPFLLSFMGGASVFTQNAFQTIATGITSTSINDITTCDLNNDGKPDAIWNRGFTLSIAPNQSANGQISFGATINIASFASGIYGLTTGDVNGDGLPDIVIAAKSNTYVPVVCVYINTSTNSSFSFALPPVTTTVTSDYYAVSMEIADLNADGKPDIVLNNDQVNKLSILKNTSSNVAVSFTAMSGVLPTGNTPYRLVCTDLNGDLKPEIAVTNINGNSASVYRNTSANGNISFDAPQTLTTGSIPRKIIAGDVDGDGKTDLLTSNDDTNTISVFKNTSSSGTISFQPGMMFAVGSSPADMAMADFNGDGKVDVAVVNSDTLAATKSTVCLLKNTSSTTAISFRTPVYYTLDKYPNLLAQGDFDGDGKSDLLVTIASNLSRAVIVKNRAGLQTISLCSGSSTYFTFKVNASNYQWQADTGNGFTNIMNGPNYAGAGTDSLVVSNAPTSFYGYQYRCVAGTDTSNTYKIIFANTWSSTIDSTWENPANWSCGSLPGSSTDVIISSGNIVISANTTIRSLRLSAGAVLTVRPGVSFVILH